MALTDDELDRRYNKLRRRRDQAELKFKTIKKEIDASRMREEEEADRAGLEKGIPYEVLNNLVKDYFALRQRRSYFQKLSEMSKFLDSSSSLRSPQTISRDFLMLELLLVGGGNRPEAVYNLQVQDITTCKMDPQYTEQMGDGTTWYVAHMREHKTASLLGRATISFPDRLYQTLLGYIKDVRPYFTPCQDQTSPLFLTVKGAILEASHLQ